MSEENLDGLMERFKAAEMRDPSSVHRSSMHIYYLFWGDERTIDGETREVLNYALISKSLAEGGVWCWAPLPKFSKELSAEREFTVNAEIEAARKLCTAEAVAEHGRLLLLLAREATDWRMGMLETIGGSSDQRAHGASYTEEYRSKARRLTDQLVNHFRAYVSNVLVCGERVGAVSFANLKETHDALKTLWKEASKIATQARRSKLRRDGWRDEVRSFFERHGFEQVDGDLITRLDDPDTWPIDLHDALERHGADSKPYDIALEHAARFCGFPGYTDYSLTLRRLKQKLKNGYIAKNG